MKRTLAMLLFGWCAFCRGEQIDNTQYYTAAEVFESVPIWGKSSLRCITCEDVIVGYRLGIRVVQNLRVGKQAIIFDIQSKTPVEPGTWVKVGMRVDLVVPIKVVGAVARP